MDKNGQKKMDKKKMDENGQKNGRKWTKKKVYMQLYRDS